MGRVDGLVIPRSYNDYFSRSDPTAIRQLVAQYTDSALSATSKLPVQNKVIKGALDNINTLIPAQASESNKLADKAFVNSSIGTNTANYISNNGQPFTSVSALESYSGTVTNNDYAFVTGIDSAGNVYYDRYKATVSGSNVRWAKEYRLNNSSFTAEQWAAISSGITAAKVAQYDAGVTPVDTVALNNMSSVTSNAVAAAINTEVTNRNAAIANAQNVAVGYSSSERLTGGNWVDGRAVYRKTLVYSNVAFNNSTQLPTYIATNATIISMHCIACDTGGNLFNVPYYNVYANTSFAYYLNNTNKVINLVASTNDSIFYFHFIIEYAL